MSFNLLAYAAQHRYRVRNLHDGNAVPPARRTPRCRSVAYRSADDRCDVIVCRDGYVDYGGYGPDRIGFCVLCRSRRALSARLRLLAQVGATVTQEGDTEAAGHAPVISIDELLAALRAYRRRETRAGAWAPGLQASQPAGMGVPGRSAQRRDQEQLAAKPWRPGCRCRIAVRTLVDRPGAHCDPRISCPHPPVDWRRVLPTSPHPRPHRFELSSTAVIHCQGA